MQTVPQILIILGIGLALGLTPPIRNYVARCRRSDLCLAACFALALLGGQWLCIGKYTFPFVNWSMYASVNEEPTFDSVEIVIMDGETVIERINPIQRYPSLIHCLTPRFVRLVRAAEEGRLTEHGKQVYDRVIRSLIDSDQLQLRDGVETVEVHLITVRKRDRERLEDQIVSKHEYGWDVYKSRGSLEAARPLMEEQ